ncbi:hypothetical protein IU433_02505 [Nocardia puris]|uniref:hypothetical protein n=1 Tax=Nocardia puris TaxID=208602 RepID=UPI0018958806|nr:hypothetical protein [Nocardia puris]MBF6210657.1 hypothetical protein [Nocardia puris]MBF6369383.1 hypothetical protein [Nocardia puris]MBF6457918.1 hypothetical protein [Nocardia puris]
MIDGPVILTVTGMLVTGVAFTAIRFMGKNRSATIVVLGIGALVFLLTLVVAGTAEERRQDRWRAEQAAAFAEQWDIRARDNAELPGGQLFWARTIEVDISGRTTYCSLTALRRDRETGMWASPADLSRSLSRYTKLRLDCAD